MSCLPLNLNFAKAYPTNEPVMSTMPVVMTAMNKLLSNERSIGIFFIIVTKFPQVGCDGHKLSFPISLSGEKAAPIIQMNG